MQPDSAVWPLAWEFNSVSTRQQCPHKFSRYYLSLSELLHFNKEQICVNLTIWINWPSIAVLCSNDPEISHRAFMIKICIQFANLIYMTSFAIELSGHLIIPSRDDILSSVHFKGHSIFFTLTWICTRIVLSCVIWNSLLETMCCHMGNSRWLINYV